MLSDEEKLPYKPANERASDLFSKPIRRIAFQTWRREGRYITNWSMGAVGKYSTSIGCNNYTSDHIFCFVSKTFPLLEQEIEKAQLER